MGLTNESTGANASDDGLNIVRNTPDDFVIALAGNPNVGKSTVFNALTGLKQHTGNWAGKTVTNAKGEYVYKGVNHVIVDIPGTYSLMSHSVEEEVARDFICFGDIDMTVVVCDATCLERNMNLVLQTIEMVDNVVVCVNLMDEAKKKHIYIDIDRLSKKLGVPVVGVSARNGENLDKLREIILENRKVRNRKKISITYENMIEETILGLEPIVKKSLDKNLNARWVTLRLLSEDGDLINSLKEYLGYDITKRNNINEHIREKRKNLKSMRIERPEQIDDKIVSEIIRMAEDISKECVEFKNTQYNSFDRKIDKILTGKLTGIPIMILLLAVIFWITIEGANYPSQFLSKVLFSAQDKLSEIFFDLSIPTWIHDMLVLGVFRVLAWVISVMLPPMAIFFPLFTLLEDLGYLPRVAFNLDKGFKKCCACGKQALTMCIVFLCSNLI